MCYFWNEEFSKAIGDGCEVRLFVVHSQKILEHVISLIPEITKNAVNMFVSNHASEIKRPGLPKYLNRSILSNKSANLSTKTNSTVLGYDLLSSMCYSSRHFSPFLQNREDYMKDASDEHVVKTKVSKCKSPLINDNALSSFVKKLSHDDDTSAELVSMCWKQQIAAEKQTKFKTEGIIICPITLPCSYSTVVEGLIIKSNLNSNYGQDLNVIENKKTLIIKGSVTFEYVHLGFSPKAAVITKKASDEILSSEKDEWINKCCKTISELQVNILLVRGSVDPAIASFCFAHSVFLLVNIPWATLKVLSQAANITPCTYLLNCDKRSLANNIFVKEWHLENLTIIDGEYYQIVVNNSTKKITLCTVVLCNPSPFILSKKEHMFWHLASRLNSATESNQILPGGGKTEEWCFNTLKQLHIADTEARVTLAIANGFHNFHEEIKSKKDRTQNTTFSEAIDDMNSKIHAWRSAMALVLIILQCDTLLINGFGELIEKEIQFGQEISGFL